jgi:hypothetical protein
MLVVPSPPMPGRAFRSGRRGGTPQSFICPGGALHSWGRQGNVVCLVGVNNVFFTRPLSMPLATFDTPSVFYLKVRPQEKQRMLWP